MPAGALAPSPYFLGLDDDGNPLVGGLLYTYAAGTSTPLATYSDSVGTPNSNPVVLDAGGRATVYLQKLAYKFILMRSDGTTVRTQDNVVSTDVGVATGGVGQIATLGGDVSYLSPDAAILSGATYDKLHVGSIILRLDSAIIAAEATYKLECMMLSVSGVAINCALVNLTDAPDTPIASCQSTSTVGEVQQSGAVSFAAGVKDYGIKVWGAGANAGYVWSTRIVRIA